MFVSISENTNHTDFMAFIVMAILELIPCEILRERKYLTERIGTIFFNMKKSFAGGFSVDI